MNCAVMPEILLGYIVTCFPNRMPSGGYFPFPAHGEPGQGVSAEAEFRLGRNVVFCDYPFSSDVLPRFQCFSRYRLLLLAPFLRRRGSFCSGTLLFRPSFSNFPFLFFYFEKQKRRMRAFHSPRRSDAKKFLIRLFVIQFFLVCRVKNPMTCVRAPPKS